MGECRSAAESGTLKGFKVPAANSQPRAITTGADDRRCRGAEEMRPVRRGTHGGMLTRRTGGLDARPSSPYVCESGAAQYLTLGGH